MSFGPVLYQRWRLALPFPVAGPSVQTQAELPLSPRCYA